MYVFEYITYLNATLLRLILLHCKNKNKIFNTAILRNINESRQKDSRCQMAMQ